MRTHVIHCWSSEGNLFTEELVESETFLKVPFACFSGFLLVFEGKIPNGIWLRLLLVRIEILEGKVPDRCPLFSLSVCEEGCVQIRVCMFERKYFSILIGFLDVN